MGNGRSRGCNDARTAFKIRDTGTASATGAGPAVKSPPIALKFTNPDQLSNDEVQRIFDRANRLPDTAAAVRLYSEWAAIYDETVCRFGEYLTPASITRRLRARSGAEQTG